MAKKNVPSHYPQWTARISTFQPGTGKYICIDCGKLTRDTGLGEASVEMCARCYEVNMLDNSLADGDITESEYNDKMEELAAKYDKK